MTTYRGHNYYIEKTESKRNPRFYTITPIHPDGSRPTFETPEDATKHVQGVIDAFIDTVPQTKQEWVKELERALIALDN